MIPSFRFSGSIRLRRRNNLILRNPINAFSGTRKEGQRRVNRPGIDHMSQEVVLVRLVSQIHGRMYIREQILEQIVSF